MDFTWSDEDAAFRRELREFLDAALPPDWDEVSKDGPESDAQAAFAREFCPRLAEKGWLTQHWPREVGGGGSEMTSMPVEEMRQFADEFRDLLYEMPFQVPQNIIFLARCVGILSVMCTGLDPQFNVWEHLAPYARKLIAEEARTGKEFWLGEIETLAKVLLVMPRRVDQLLTWLERGELAVRTPDSLGQMKGVEGGLRLVAGSITFLAFFLAGTQFYLARQEVVGIIFYSVAGVNFAWLTWRWRGR